MNDSTMTIWLDDDACPRRIRDIVVKAAERLELPVKSVAHQARRALPSRQVEMILVSEGMDAADDYIAEHVKAGDLVITNDVPLADRIVSQQAFAINPKGKVFDTSSIKEHLAMRNLSQDLRDAGDITGGPRPLSDTDIRLFSSSFDRLLTRLYNRTKR